MRKFKCIKSYESGEWLTKGKIYTEDNGKFRYDDGWINTAFDYDNAHFDDNKMSDYLEEIKGDKKMDKFKVGDVVRIIGNESGHCFNIGDIVELYEVKNDNARCRRIGENQTFGNNVWFCEMELIKEKKEDFNTKTLTITTSDTTTTITDGTHTTSVNRYHTDKHNDMVALEEVIKKYKSEMEEIERAEKMPKVGDKVKVVDSGETYDTNKSFLVENKDKINIETIIKWESGELPEKDNVYKVVFKKDNKFIVEDDNSSYIMNAKGLEVIK